MTDEFYMKRCLFLAKKGIGYTSPNPLVGCVIVYDNKIVFYGVAYLNYGEYYLMFGWLGISTFSLLLGHLFKRLWSWINIHKEEPLALIL